MKVSSPRNDSLQAMKMCQIVSGHPVIYHFFFDRGASVTMQCHEWVNPRVFSGGSGFLNASIIDTEAETGFGMTVDVVRNALESSDAIQSVDDSRSTEQFRADIHDLPPCWSIKEFSSPIVFDE